MSANTKQLILDTFIEELRSKPFDKITVSQLIKKANISRNTFYYHFEDIYALLIFLLEREKEKITNNILFLLSWDDVLKELIHYAQKNREIIYHIYQSMPKEKLEQYFFATTENIIEKIVRLESKGLNVTDEDIFYIAEFYRYAIMGFLKRFLWNNMELDAEEHIDKMAEIFKNNIPELLRQCEIKNQHK